MTHTSRPVRPSRPDLRSCIVASLAVIALLLGGLALHTASASHGGHAPSGTAAASAAHIGSTEHPVAVTVATLATGLIAAGPAVASAAVDHGLGADLLAACALLLALAGSVALILLGRSGRHLTSGTRGDRHQGRLRRHGPPVLVLAVHRPDLIVLSVSRR